MQNDALPNATALLLSDGGYRDKLTRAADYPAAPETAGPGPGVGQNDGAFGSASRPRPRGGAAPAPLMTEGRWRAGMRN